MEKKNISILNLQGVLSVLVLLIHAASLNINLPGRELQTVYGFNYSTFIQMFFSEGICRMAVPLFFTISGYLFYKSFDGSFEGYQKKIRRRVYSIVVPYLIWSSFVFLAFVLAQKLFGLNGYFTTRNDSSLSLIRIFNDVIIDSYNSPLWYLRYLMVLSLLSIVLYPIYRYIPTVWLSLCIYGWLFNFIGFPVHIPFRMEAVFFYSVGAFAGIHRKGSTMMIEALKECKKKWMIVMAVCYFLTIVYHSWKLCLMPYTFLLEGYYDVAIDISGKIGILLGSVLIIWVFLTFAWLQNHQWTWVKYSFLLFVAHHPIVNTLKKVLAKYSRYDMSPFLSLFLFISSATLTFIIVLGFGCLFRKVSPKGYSIISGGR